MCVTASIPCQQITDNNSCILPCLTTETSKSQATNHTSCHASHRYHQITGNNLYILPCLTQMPANQRQQIVHLAMSHTDTGKSNVKRKSSRRYDLLRALGSASCDITHEAGDTSCDITHEPRARFVAILTVCCKSPSNNMCVTVSLPRRPYN